MKKPMVGDIVHYTDAERGAGLKPTPPLAALVLSICSGTGRLTLLVWRPEYQATAGGMVAMAAVIPNVEHSKEPAGSMAARGCWSVRK